MKAICIKNSKEIKSATFFKGESRLIKYDLTIGKVYEINIQLDLAPNILPKKCDVTDDRGKYIYTNFDLFKPIEEYRNEQIEQILK